MLARGLHRMSRNFIALCKEFSEEEVSSEMPRNCSVFIWVDVHRAIKEGLRFYETVRRQAAEPEWRPGGHRSVAGRVRW